MSSAPLIELPPSSKKLSWMPTFRLATHPRTSRQMAARSLSSGVRGGTALAAPAPWRASGAGSALRSTLPLGVSGKAVEDDEGGRHHVVGQPRGQEVRAGAPRPARAVAADHVGHQARPPRRRRSVATTTASRHRRVGGERGLDLAQLDAEAADLDLVVEAAEVLDRRRPAASGPGRRCGRGARRAAPPKGSGTKRSAVSSGRLQVAAGRPARRRCTARRRRRPAPAAAGRSSTWMLRVGDRPADRARCRRASPRRRRQAGDVDRGLGGAVEVVQLGAGQRAKKRSRELGRQRLAAADHPPQARRSRRRPGSSRKTWSIGGHEVQRGDPLARRSASAR